MLCTMIYFFGTDCHKLFPCVFL